MCVRLLVRCGWRKWFPTVRICQPCQRKCGAGSGSNGVDQIAGNVPVVMAKVFESMKEATGIDLADIINAESYDAKVNRNVNVSGLDSVNFVVKDDGTKVTMAKVEPQNSTKPVSTDVPESGEQG